MAPFFARNNIPRGRISCPIFPADMKFENETEGAEIFVDMDINSTLVVQDKIGNLIDPSVLIGARLAGDVHSANMEIYTDSTKEMLCWRIRLVKDVAVGDELVMWFGDDVLVTLNMPFLTPGNIKGRKNYQCHECGTQYEQPNPLKLHLFLSCEKFSIPKFWKKFLRAHTNPTSALNLTTSRLSSPVRPKSHENDFIGGNNIYKSSRCLSEPPYSAFRPYMNRSIQPDNCLIQFNNNTRFVNYPLLSDSQLPKIINCPSLGMYDLPSNKIKISQTKTSAMSSLTKSLDGIRVTNALEVEAFATSWGKSKEGHLCIYCGKVYSRKYGLKIHIRTHTGYKPLQCKYCSRPFGDPSNLNKHVRLHAQSDTPYSCDSCGKLLVRKRDLERHIRSRHCSDSGDADVDISD